MKTKELNVYYAKVFLDAFENEKCCDGLNESERFAAVYDRFKREYGWLIDRKGEQNALIEWLQGLAVSIPYSYHEIEKMLDETGYVNISDRKRALMVDNYWHFMACKFFFLKERRQAWFEINVK